jgi:quinol monooxygenase YgiN
VADDAKSLVPVMTVLEGTVPPERWEELVRLFQEGGARRPPQMLESFLVQDAADATRWRGISLWRSREALEAYRQSVTTPRGVAMFREAGAEPTLGIWSVHAASAWP